MERGAGSGAAVRISSGSTDDTAATAAAAAAKAVARRRPHTRMYLVQNTIAKDTRAKKMRRAILERLNVPTSGQAIRAAVSRGAVVLQATTHGGGPSYTLLLLVGLSHCVTPPSE